MDPNVIFIVFSLVLLAAVGVLVFGIGKFIYGIAHYHLRERKPIREIQHPQLGLLTTDESDETLWTGQATINGRDIPFLLRGSATAPEQRLVVQLQSILAHIFDWEQRAIEFLRSREPETRDSKLDLYMLDVSHERRPGSFTFEFVNNADDSQIWRVEFVDGEAKHTGFDD